MKFKKYADGACVAWTMVSNCPEIPSHIIRHIIKQTGIPEEEFY